MKMRNKNEKKVKKIEFSTKSKVNKTTVSNNWLEKIENFIKEGTHDSKKCIFYMFEKDMKKSARNPRFGYDRQYYPSDKSILIKDKRVDLNTKKENNVFILKEEDYGIGLSFYRKTYETNIIEILTDINMQYLIKLIESKKITNEKEIILKIKASIAQLRIRNKDINKSINAVTFPILLNLLYSLSQILNFNFSKLQCKKWSKLIPNELIDEYDFFIAKKLENLPSDNVRTIDNIFKTFKGLRDLFTHYYEYKKTEKDINKYLLLRVVYWGNSIYIIVIKNYSHIQIYEYKINNLIKEIKNALLVVLKEEK